MTRQSKSDDLMDSWECTPIDEPWHVTENECEEGTDEKTTISKQTKSVIL